LLDLWQQHLRFGVAVISTQISSGFPHIRLDCCRKQSMHGDVLNREAPMAEEFASEVVKRFTGEIVSRWCKASALASTAQKLNSQGMMEHALDTLMDVEPPIFEATALLNAASIVKRSAGEGERIG
jgi:hypothetical protein